MSITKYPPGIKLPLYGIYPALDGEVAIAALTDSELKRLFKAIALEEMVKDFQHSSLE